MFLGIDFLRVWCGFLNFSVLSGLGFLYLDASHSFGIGILLGLVCAAVGVLISYWGIRRHYRRLAVLATSQSVDEEQGKAMEQLFRTRMQLTQVLGGLLALFNEVLMFNLYGPSFFSLESIVILLFFIFLRFLFDYLRARFQESISYELIARDRLAVGDALKRVSLGYFQNMNTGTILNSITTGLHTLEGMGIRMIDNFVGGYLNFICILLWLICIDRKSTRLNSSHT